MGGDGFHGFSLYHAVSGSLQTLTSVWLVSTTAPSMRLASTSRAASAACPLNAPRTIAAPQTRKSLGPAVVCLYWAS